MTARAGQLAVISTVSEAPPAPLVGQLVVIATVNDYYVPQILVPLGLGQFLFTMPYFIGEF